MNYYNDNDPAIAQWLRNLIGAGQIPPGDVVKLRAYGNSIVPPVAAVFVTAFLEVEAVG